MKVNRRFEICDLHSEITLSITKLGEIVNNIPSLYIFVLFKFTTLIRYLCTQNTRKNFANNCILSIIVRMRIAKVRKLLSENKFDALFISSAYNIRYLTGFDGFGTHEREGFALLTQSNLYVCADPRLSEGARKNSQGATIVEFSAGKKLIPQLQKILDKEKIQVLGFEENLTYSEYKRFRKLKNIKFKMSEDIIEFVRQEKDIEELQSLKKACELTDETFSHILKLIKQGQTELEVAWEMEKYIREHGGELAFPTIVAFGENSAVPHHKTGNKKLENDSIILLDFGAKVDGYCADMTRTVFIGRTPDQFKKMYEAVRIGQQLPFETALHEITPEFIDKTARDFVISQGFPSVPHSVGHGVGLEVHELPHISPGFKEIIEPNTPFTIEPGVYIPGFGGVRIEDTVFFNGEKLLPLTNSYKNLIEL